ncbi:CoA transferase subunit A [Bacillus sp. 1P06AnD]|uniref:CoA transferase subunit A n=1 Tax=Bacillus sp. 1P06AnD TaxID=3132208 RepID=UPI0039A025C6
MQNVFGKVVDIEELAPFFMNGMSIMFGGFGGVGNPPTLIDFIRKCDLKDLTLIGNDTGFPDIGIGRLITEKRVKKLIVSHIGSNPNAGKQMHEGTLEIEFSPQGILMERIRAGGFGIPAILSDIAVGHEAVRLNKPIIEWDGKEYLLESALRADVSIIFAKKVDEFGNAVYDKSARNTNPLVATASDITIVEAESIVPAGAIDPEEIVTPGIYNQYIVQSEGVNWRWAWEKM